MRIQAVVLALALLARSALASEVEHDELFDNPMVEYEYLLICNNRTNLEILIDVARVEGAEGGVRQMQIFAARGGNDDCGIKLVGKVESFKELKTYFVKNLSLYRLIEVRVVLLQYADGTVRYAALDRVVEPIDSAQKETRVTPARYSGAYPPEPMSGYGRALYCETFEQMHRLVLLITVGMSAFDAAAHVNHEAKARVCRHDGFGYVNGEVVDVVARDGVVFRIARVVITEQVRLRQWVPTALLERYTYFVHKD